jgi:hypothetical protein
VAVTDIKESIALPLLDHIQSSLTSAVIHDEAIMLIANGMDSTLSGAYGGIKSLQSLWGVIVAYKDGHIKHPWNDRNDVPVDKWLEWYAPKQPNVAIAPLLPPSEYVRHLVSAVIRAFSTTPSILRRPFQSLCQHVYTDMVSGYGKQNRSSLSLVYAVFSLGYLNVVAEEIGITVKEALDRG